MRRRGWLVVLSLLVAGVLALTHPPTAAAAPGPTPPPPGPDPCAPYAEWAARCSEADFSFVVTACPDSVIIGSARIGDGEPLDIEVSQDNPKAFRRVGTLGVQPIGEFPDWNRVPASKRDTLTRAVACIERIGPPEFTASSPTPRGSPRLLVSGLLLMLCAAGLAVHLGRRRGADATERGAPSSRFQLRTDMIALAALTLTAALARWLLVVPAPFHQNGQAPLWIAEAARTPLSPSIYGPGFDEVYSWLAASGEADTRVYVLNSLLLAACVPLSHLVFRVAGAGRGAAWLCSAVISAHPLLARLAGGESYLATIGGLGMLAAGSLALAAQPGESLGGDRRRVYLFLCGIGGAACLIAQAARVHPIGWLPLATLAFVVPCLGGALRARALRSSVAALLIAAVVALTSLMPMLSVLQGELGQRWLPATSVQLSLPRMLLFLPLWLLTKRRALDFIPVVALCLCVELAVAANSLRAASRLIDDAYVTLYLPATLVAVAAYLASLRWSSLKLASCVALAVALLGLGWARREAYLTLPTDAREVQLLTGWLREMPKPGSVLYLGRAGQRVLLLPRYDHAVIIYQAAANDTPPPFRGARELHYYRSSLCATEEGQASCRELESRLVLEPVVAVDLPSVASLPYLPLPPGKIEVGWYRVKSVLR